MTHILCPECDAKPQTVLIQSLIINHKTTYIFIKYFIVNPETQYLIKSNNRWA